MKAGFSVSRKLAVWLPRLTCAVNISKSQFNPLLAGGLGGDFAKLNGATMSKKYKVFKSNWKSFEDEGRDAQENNSVNLTIKRLVKCAHISLKNGLPRKLQPKQHAR